jgi:hypothetical protein
MPVVTVAPPPPCVLPALPAPMPAQTVTVDGDDYRVSRASWALLVARESSWRIWVQSALTCLRERRSLP